MTFNADPAERLVAPPRPAKAREWTGFGAILALCLLTHLALLALLLSENTLDAPPSVAEQEIPVEVVVEPPPEEKVEPPPANPKQPPPKQQVQQEEYEKPAFDAPRAENKESLERETAEKESAAPNIAPLKERAEAESKPNTDTNPAPQAEPPSQSAEKQAEEVPQAEIVEPASPTPETPKEKSQADAKVTPPPNKRAGTTIAEQVAALAPLPDFKLGSKNKASPVSGGNAKTTYLTILYGLIVPRMQIPPGVRALHSASDGIVAFYIDERGNLTHQAVVRGSGVPDLDAAAIRAVRQAAPFPAPPLGHPRSILFRYNTR